MGRGKTGAAICWWLRDLQMATPKLPRPSEGVQVQEAGRGRTDGGEADGTEADGTEADGKEADSEEADTEEADRPPQYRPPLL